VAAAAAPTTKTTTTTTPAAAAAPPPPSLPSSGPGAPPIEAFEITWPELSFGPQVGQGGFGVVYRCEWRPRLGSKHPGAAAALAAAAAGGGGPSDPLPDLDAAMVEDEGVQGDGAPPSSSSRSPPHSSPPPSVTVAVKVRRVAHGDPTTPRALEEFRREVATMHGLPPHPNVVPIVGWVVDPEREAVALVTPFMRRGSLYGVLRRGPSGAPRKQRRSRGGGGGGGGGSSDGGGGSSSEEPMIPWLQRARILLAAARGVGHLHARNVLHRDLKSGNVLVNDDKALDVRVCDFGLSRRAQGNELMTPGIGTPYWMAPEVIAHQRYSTKADVYSYGLMLWEAAAGETPFRELEGMQAAFAVWSRGARPPMPLDTPARLAALIRRCWAALPAQRPEFTEIVRELEVLVGELEGGEEGVRGGEGVVVEEAAATKAPAAATAVPPPRARGPPPPPHQQPHHHHPHQPGALRPPPKYDLPPPPPLVAGRGGKVLQRAAGAAGAAAATVAAGAAAPARAARAPAAAADAGAPASAPSSAPGTPAKRSLGGIV
jgi:serine/threonine protein kinase